MNVYIAPQKIVDGFLFVVVIILIIECEGWISPSRSTPAESCLRHVTAIPVFRNPADLPFVKQKEAKISPVDRDFYIQELLEFARRLGPVGVLRSLEEQQRILDASLSAKEYSDANPALIPLNGTHKLVYSAAPGGSSGKIGPFVGKVSQEFIDDQCFINSVEFGPLRIALTAERKVRNENIIDVFFKCTTVYLFGQKVAEQEIKGGGSWNFIFCGKIQDKNGRNTVIRIMETPSLFILEQIIS